MLSSPLLVLSGSSFIQHAVAVLVPAMLEEARVQLLHIILTRAQGTVGRLLNHSCSGRWRDREILFSAYLGIYCSAECNITVQKQDPNHINLTIPPSTSSLFLLLSLSKLHYITASSKKAPSLPAGTV